MNTAALEQALYLQALEEDQSRLPVEAAAGLGALAGGAAGLSVGQTLHSLGNKINRGLDVVAPQAVPRGQRIRDLVKPGNRMAGALVGFLLGGGGGVALRDAMIQESDEARLLAKLQMGTELDAIDLRMLEDIAANHYDNMAQFSRSA